MLIAFCSWAAKTTGKTTKHVEKSHQKMHFSIQRVALSAVCAGAVALCGVARASESSGTRDVRSDRIHVWAGFEVAGATALAPEDLERAYAGDVGARRDRAVLVAIADRITELYRARGYFLSRAIVPEQSLADFGIGRVVVIEGRIDTVRFEGVDRPLVRAAFADSAGPGPASLTDLRRALARARDLPGVKVSTRIEPVPNDAARHTLVVRVERAEFRLNLSVDVDSTYDEHSGAMTGTAVVGGGGGLPDRVGLWLRRPGQASDGAAGAGAFGSTAVNGSTTIDGRADIFRAADGVEGGGGALGVTSRVVRTERFGLWAGGEVEARTMRRDARTDDLSGRIFIKGQLDDEGRSTGFVALATIGERRDHGTVGANVGGFAKIEGQVWGRFLLPLGIRTEGSLWAQGSFGPLPEGEQVWFGGDRLGRGIERGRASGDHAIVVSAEAIRSF